MRILHKRSIEAIRAKLRAGRAVRILRNGAIMAWLPIVPNVPDETTMLIRAGYVEIAVCNDYAGLCRFLRSHQL